MGDLKTRKRGFEATGLQHWCAHCGRTCGNFAGGWSSTFIDGIAYKLCHPNVTGRPDCYTLVTRDKHNIECTTCHVEKTK